MDAFANLQAWWVATRSQVERSRAFTIARWGIIAFALALTVATWLPCALHIANSSWPSLDSLVHEACGPFCHQLPSRSFHINDYCLPLCARCSGMWVGITLGVAVALLRPVPKRWSAGTALTLVALGLSAWDHVRELDGGAQDQALRAWLGLLLFLGFTVAISYDALALLIAGVLRLLHRSDPPNTHAVMSPDDTPR